ncbi:hypothetical protein EOD41_14430 [Mucilaginibacter limnophilus]|uniref:histidine kinase n=1 Tax=Mucilaginibacter limnophilus TaxID=1932778 RepID=A0A437MRB8_9SPHI|nr:histidine kinase [Mucilaginibacter limnophilus]RVU00153.1 hypothetical protein EOD41_14430 [Mucilaginibacter limnophilus]
MQGITPNIYVLILGGMVTVFFMVLTFIALNVRGQNKLLKQRQAAQKAEIAHQKELLSAVIESQEAERKRVGRDLHDDVGTALSSLRLIIEMSKPTPDALSHNNFVSSTKEIIDKVIKDVRSISHNLSPTTLNYYGLTTAVEEHCNIINQSGKLRAFLIDDTVSAISKLNVSSATAFYRVLEELLNNTIKHAEATETSIKFSEKEDTLILEYRDNGKGMEPNFTAKKGMGLQNIESRLNNINAGYEIITAPGKGFSLNISYQILRNT